MKKPAAVKSKSEKSKAPVKVKKDNDVYQYEKQKIRNEKNRAGDIADDSDGEFKGEDESIDDDASEVGWDSDDEMAYGHMFKGKKSDLSSSGAQSDDSESDQEEACEGEVLLSDMFSSNKKITQHPDKKTSSSSAKVEDSKKPSEDSNDDDSQSDEDAEDEDAENEDDDDDDDEEEDDEDDEEEDRDSDEQTDENSDTENSDDDENDDAHNRLMNAIDKFSKTHDSEPAAKKKKISNQSAQESVFSSVADDGAVSMDALLGALGEVKGINVVKKQLVDLEKGTSVPSYVEKVIAERIERTLAYDGAAVDMSKWQETVSTNRHVRTLDLAQDKRILPNYKDLVKKFVPRTDMEREVQMILVKTGATDDLAAKKEEDELGSRTFSVEEMKERQAELAKVKALMFYEQMKRHRLNKIKSKAYRRIRKHKKGKLGADGEHDADLDPEAAWEEEEKEALRHVKERMDMKHKNTGKWARMALQHGHHDESLRLAYHESVQLGHELSKRIHEDPSRRKDDGEGGGDSSGDEEFETEAKEGQMKKKASDRAAREMLSVLEGAEDEPEAHGKYKKLFEMDFMKRATDQKKEKSREEAQNILRELQDMESYNSSGDEDGDTEARPEKVSDAKSLKGVIAAAMKKEADSEALVAARAEMARQMGSGSLTLRTGSKKVSVLGPISINTDDKSTKKKGKNAGADNSTGVRWLSETEDDVADITAAASTEDDSNPWLAAPTLGKKRDSNGLHTNITVASGRSKGEGAEKLYVTVADIGSTTNASKNAAKKNKGKQTGEAVALSVSTDGAKRPASMTLESKNSMKKAKVEGSSSSGKGNSDLSLTAAKAVATPAPAASDCAAGMSAKSKERKPLLLQRSQEDLVQMAFAGPDLEADFAKMKGADIDEELGIEQKRNKILNDVKAGWGDWAGPGATGVSAKILSIRDRQLKIVEEETALLKKGRKDTKIPNVIISDRRVKTAAKYKIAELPHPFKSREEYERSMQMPLGAEWNATNVVKSNSMPTVLLRAGRIVQPIAMTKNQVNAAKKEAGVEEVEKKKISRTIKSNKKHKK